MGIGSFYNAKGVIVGQAMGLYGPEYTPLPADRIALFDEATWASSSISLGGATGGTYTLSLSRGPLAAVGSGPTQGTVTTAAIAFGANAAAVATAITTALNALGVFNLVPVVTGTGAVATPFLIALVGPGGSEVVISANTGTLTGATGAGVTPPLWTPCGSTEAGWQTNYSPSVQDIHIEEQQTPVGRQVTTATYEFTANLSEDTMENLALALSGARTITAGDSTHYGSDELALTDTLPLLAVVLETKNRRGYPRSYYIPSATCAVNVGQTFARARGQHLIPVTFSSVCPLGDIRIRNITANKG